MNAKLEAHLRELAASRKTSGASARKTTTKPQRAATKKIVAAPPDRRVLRRRKSDPQTSKPETFDDWAENYLPERGCTIYFAELNDVEPINAAEAFSKKYLSLPGILFNNYDPLTKQLTPESSQERYWQSPTIDGKERKISLPTGGKPDPYFARTLDWKTAFKDTKIDLIISEGPTRALAGAQRGLHVIALPGIACHGGDVLPPTLNKINWVGRRVDLAFDYDTQINQQSRAHVRKLARKLFAQGALVFIIDIPNLTKGGHAGMDDMLALPGGLEVFNALKRAAPQWFPQSEAEYPAPLSEAAFHGPVGEFVKLVLPETEADPAALTTVALTMLGCLIGRTPFYQVEDTQHHARLYSVVVGATAASRKGTATDRVLKLLGAIDADFLKMRKRSGLSSGEGLIQAVRDPRTERVARKEPKTDEPKPKFVRNQTGKMVPFEDKITDYGEPDKRLLIVEPEFANVLHQAAREGNILSTVLRDAWDGKPLRVLARSNQDSCAAPHIGVVGNITSEEARRLLTATDKANGFANRFLWVCAERSQLLPLGGDEINPRKWASLVANLKKAVPGAHQE
jgi:hypothetical protein